MSKHTRYLVLRTDVPIPHYWAGGDVWTTNPADAIRFYHKSKGSSMFISVQPFDMTQPPRLVNVSHIVELRGETLVLSSSATIRLSAESVLRLHSLLPKLE